MASGRDAATDRRDAGAIEENDAANAREGDTFRIRGELRGKRFVDVDDKRKGGRGGGGRN